ncbi:ferredoxin [Frankia nepalensis]|uniref:ferredoxin n=1 Tax=Frankia nepalensis TaxID=1836974 RepID=UPI001EE494E0|nr:ferredoxin [Frankia nepalensis]
MIASHLPAETQYQLLRGNVERRFTPATPPALVGPEVAMLAVNIDREACIGSGTCVVYAGTSTHGDQAEAVVLDPPGDPPDVIIGAVEPCPTSARSLMREERGA